jgi:membrane protease YdiL (CAAX protease family)
VSIFVSERNSLSSPEDPQFEPDPLNRQLQTPAPFVVEPFLPPAEELQPTKPAPKAGEDPVWTGWDVLQIAGLTLLLTLFVVPLLTVSGAHILVYPHESWLEVARKPVLALLSQLLSYVVVVLYMILLVQSKYRARFFDAIRWNWPGIAGVSFLGVGVLMLGFDILGRFLPMPKTTPFDQFFDRPFDAYLTAAFAVSLGPLIEEIFFRGFLYPVAARRLGAAWGIFLTALPFGLMHLAQYGYSWGAVLIVFLVGVVLTAVRAMTKSVAASFLAHVGYNGTLMALAAWSTDGFRHMDKAGLGLF